MSLLSRNKNWLGYLHMVADLGYDQNRLNKLNKLLGKDAQEIIKLIDKLDDKTFLDFVKQTQDQHKAIDLRRKRFLKDLSNLDIIIKYASISLTHRARLNYQNNKKPFGNNVPALFNEDPFDGQEDRKKEAVIKQKQYKHDINF